MIKVRSQCEYLKHLPAYLGDTMEKQLAQGDKYMEILIRQWQPKEMKDRNWTSANYFWWNIQKEERDRRQVIIVCGLPGSTREFRVVLLCSQGTKGGATEMEECLWL